VSTGDRLALVDEGHRVTSLELFFDLVFVFAITQVTGLMSSRTTATSLVQGLMLLAVLWWCWCCFAWLGTTVQADEGVARLALLAAMAVAFLVALTIPEAFDDRPGGLRSPLLFAGCYLAVRVLHIVTYTMVGRGVGDSALLGVLRRMAPPMLAAAALLAAAAFTGGRGQLALWAVALVIDYSGVFLAGPRGWRLTSPAHFAERHGLIVIIALGESIVAIGVGVADLPMSWPVVLSAVLGLAVAGALWWMYFDVAATVAEHRLGELSGQARVAMARDSYTYLHLPMIGGIVLLALGLKKALLYVADTEHYGPGTALRGIPLWALTAGVALFLAAHSAFRRRNIGGWNRQRLVAAAVLLAGTPLLAHVPAEVAVAVVAALCVALIGYERWRFGGIRAQVRADVRGRRQHS
jgi:low temperature requirement protein LtrA